MKWVKASKVRGCEIEYEQWYKQQKFDDDRVGRSVYLMPSKREMVIPVVKELSWFRAISCDAAEIRMKITLITHIDAWVATVVWGLSEREAGSSEAKVICRRTERYAGTSR